MLSTAPVFAVLTGATNHDAATLLAGLALSEPGRLAIPGLSRNVVLAAPVGAVGVLLIVVAQDRLGAVFTVGQFATVFLAARLIR